MVGTYSSKCVTSQDIEKYIPLVHKVVNQLNVPSSIVLDRDDLVSIGMFGLLDAYNRFDVTKGASFEMYAKMRVRGTIVDEIRKMGLIPRKRMIWVKDLLLKQEQLQQTLMRTPTDEELLKSLGWESAELFKTYEAINLLSTTSLEDLLLEGSEVSLLPESPVMAAPQENTLKRLEREAQYNVLHQMVQLLNEKERLLLQLHYVEGLNFNEISEVLEVSPSRVSQIYRQALSSLRIYVKR